MNGPEHYRLAEQMVTTARDLDDLALDANDSGAVGAIERDAAKARADALAHAVLAAAAAFALPHVVRLRVGADEWADTLGVDLSQVTGL